MNTIGKTNEQEVVSAREKIFTLKGIYMDAIKKYISNTDENSKLKLLLECQSRANEFFNYVETFVGNSGLLGAHQNGLWVTGFAEDCYSILDSYVTHIEFLRTQANSFPEIRDSIEPPPYAYACMQRMAKEYLQKDDVKKLKKRFSEKNLPVTGFDIRAADSTTGIPAWQTITGVVIGTVFLVICVIIVITYPILSDSQVFFIRGILAIGISCITPIIPGFMDLAARFTGKGAYLKIVAGGSLAIFVLIWLVNPPGL